MPPPSRPRRVSISARAASCAGGNGEPLAGGPLTFDRVELIVWEAHRKPLRALATLPELEAWRTGLAAPQAEHVTELLQRLGAPRSWPPAGRAQVMGILNVTPDSFSDAGQHLLVEAAVAHGLRMVEEGCDIVDVGGESTRPGARPVAEAEELRRVVPVIERLAAAGVTLSIDTRKAAVMRAATTAGATIINDVSALSHEPGSLEAAAASGARVVLMHMRGEPRSMNFGAPLRGGRPRGLRLAGGTDRGLRGCGHLPRAARRRSGALLRQARAAQSRHS